MKKVVIIIDICFCIFLVYQFITEFEAEFSSDAIPLLVIFLLVIFNILSIIRKQSKDNCWLSLYLKRKALEEKKKIDKLSSK